MFRNTLRINKTKRRKTPTGLRNEQNYSGRRESTQASNHHGSQRNSEEHKSDLSAKGQKIMSVSKSTAVQFIKAAILVAETSVEDSLKRELILGNCSVYRRQKEPHESPKTAVNTATLP